MNAQGETVMVRATDQTSRSQLIIDNLPPYAPYTITDDGNILKMGMADSCGTIDIPYGEITAVLTGPVVLEYWPDSLTYAGSAHADGEGILFDPYNNAVVGFPWDPDDPLLYVSRAYVRMTIPVDGTSLDGVRLAGQDGRHARYPYLVGTYGAGDEIFVPVVSRRAGDSPADKRRLVAVIHQGRAAKLAGTGVWGRARLRLLPKRAGYGHGHDVCNAAWGRDSVDFCNVVRFGHPLFENQLRPRRRRYRRPRQVDQRPRSVLRQRSRFSELPL